MQITDHCCPFTKIKFRHDVVWQPEYYVNKGTDVFELNENIKSTVAQSHTEYPEQKCKTFALQPIKRSALQTVFLLGTGTAVLAIHVYRAFRYSLFSICSKAG